MLIKCHKKSRINYVVLSDSLAYDCVMVHGDTWPFFGEICWDYKMQKVKKNRLPSKAMRLFTSLRYTLVRRSLVCICLHEQNTCECQFQSVVHTTWWTTWEGVIKQETVLCVCVFWLLHHPPAETLKCGQTHADWWPSIMHTEGGSSNPRYRQGLLVCPCWKPPSHQTDGFNFLSDEGEK